ncbi:flap endonuclease 1 [Methanolobus tindarius DSM 2278]|uniref:Flap endonuclease 1 n=1 Tax=Methanolobus tindarius DSM 2278 TaxID=1090322 RepID=W9DTL5_METTI|nr:flap endonuclease-1 [Methanolobus tindarius]ETA69123.1 flap endonuclease 1 [Methanolobus tindarius DSM 2278]
MGTQIGTLLTKNTITYEELSGKVIAIDAYNTIYQFLSAIRQRDGSMLTDSSGNPVSHLTGLFSRTSRLREANIKPVFIFDGKPPEMKKDTLEKRKECKENAALNYEIAKDEGNLEDMKKYAQATSCITPQILADSKRLLELMGIPWIQAESEAEAQASYMVSRGDVDYVGSQDYDVFLFGAENVIRNLGSTGKRKLPGQKKYVTKTPEHISLSASLEELELSREQLIDLAICIGTDFNEGMHRVGAKTALKLIKKHGDIETLIREEDKDIRACAPLEEIKEFFLNPPVTEDYSFKWKKPDSDSLFDYLVNDRDFSEKQVLKNIQVLEERAASECQSCLGDW